MLRGSIHMKASIPYRSVTIGLRLNPGKFFDELKNLNFSAEQIVKIVSHGDGGVGAMRRRLR